MAVTEPVSETDELVDGSPAGENKSWNWHPAIPIRTNPLFEFPPDPVAIVRWFAAAWLPATEFGLYVLIAVGVYYWLVPPLAVMATPEAGWISALWLRNLLLMAGFASLLHLWLHRWQVQGNDTRFMRNRPNANHSRFFGGNQIRDNVFYTLVSGVTVWTAYEAVMWMAYANGIAPVIGFDEHPVWFVALFLLIPIWQAFHFYLVHRLLHFKPLYDRFHSVHHRNVSIGPWSGFSMHPVEHLLYLSSLFILLLVPAHPIHMLFLAYWLTLATATSHSGYQELVVGNYRTTISTFYHMLHHRYFTCNYGNVDMPIDRWFGSFNDGTTAATKRLLKRDRQSA